MSRQVNSFDVLRLLAAVLVIYGHAYPLTGHPSPQFAGNAVQSIGVKIFFVVSGYLIMGSWQRDPSPIRFLQRRALRILPGLALVVLVSVLLIGPIATQLPLREYFLSATTRGYFSNIALYVQYQLPGVFADNVYPHAVNGSLWSLPAEAAMYLLGPLAWALGALTLRSARWGVLLSALLLVACSLYFVRIQPLDPSPVVYNTSVISFLDTAPYFLLGAVYAVFGLEKYLSALTACGLWFALSFVAAGAPVLELLLYAVLPYVVLALGLATSRAATWLARRGDMSYGVYLYGFPVQQLVSMHAGGREMSPWANFALALPPVLLLAIVSWHRVERPCLRLKPNSPRLRPSHP